MHGHLNTAPDEHDAPRGVVREMLWRLIGPRSTGFIAYWIALAACYVVLLWAFGWRGVDSPTPAVILIAALLLGSPDPRIVAVVTGAMFGVLGYDFGLPIWLSVVLGIGVGGLEWLMKASVRELHAATAAASNERWSQARRRYLLFLVAMVALVMLWGGSIYLHLLAQGDPPAFVNWMLVGVGLAGGFWLWQEARRDLARTF